MANIVTVPRVTSYIIKNSPIVPRNKRYFKRSNRELSYIDSGKILLD